MNRYVVLAILAAIVATGVSISGCNRNRDNRMASSARRAQGTSARRSGQDSRPVRPAEVLSASARRNTRQRRSPAAAHELSRVSAAPYQAAVPAPMPVSYYSPAPSSYAPAQSRPRYEYAYANEPLPEPVPVTQTYSPSGMAQGTFHSQPYYAEPVYAAVPAAPVPVYQPATIRPAEPAYVPPAHPTPELAWARAALEPMAMAPARPASKPVSYPGGFVNREPVSPVCYPTPQGTEVCYPVPIPELEPVRYSRVASLAPIVPVAPAAPAAPVAPVSPAVPALTSLPAPQHVPSFQPLQSTKPSMVTRPVVQPARYERPSARPDWNNREEAMEPLRGWVPSPTTASR